MTRKDYKLIAGAFNAARKQIEAAAAVSTIPETKDWETLELYGVQIVMNMLADALAADNPQFKRIEFINACFNQHVQKKLAIPVPHEPEVHERDVRDVL